MEDNRRWNKRVTYYQEQGEAEDDPEILDLADTLQPQLARLQNRDGDDDGVMSYSDLVALIRQCAMRLVEA